MSETAREVFEATLKKKIMTRREFKMGYLENSKISDRLPTELKFLGEIIGGSIHDENSIELDKFIVRQ